MTTTDKTAQQVREEVRRHYAAAAEQVTAGAGSCSERGMLRVQPWTTTRVSPSTTTVTGRSFRTR